METALKNGDEVNAVSIGRTAAATFRQLDDPWGLSAILYHLGWGLRQFGRYEEGSRVLEQAIDVASSASLFNTVQWALADLGIAQLHLGNAEAARDLFDRAGVAAEHIGDGAGTILAGYGYGLLAQVRGTWEQARPRFATAYEGFATLGTPVWEGLALAGIARCDEVAGDTATAEERYQEALVTGRRVGEPGLTSMAIEGLARLAAAGGELAEAAELLADATELRGRYVRPRPPYEEQALAPLTATLEAAPAT
jgi:tetratricopeptide (TPR) repeat protein